MAQTTAPGAGADPARITLAPDGYCGASCDRDEQVTVRTLDLEQLSGRSLDPGTTRQ